MASPPWTRDSRLWGLLLGTCLTLLMAWILKGHCLSANWGANEQYTSLCYNDIQPLYGARSMDQHVVPYVGAPGTNPDSDHTPKGFVEYPVLTGLLMYLAATLSSDGNEFMVWNSIFLAAFALGTTLVLFATLEDKRRVAYWAAAPPLILYAFHNWDLQAVFWGTLGLFLYTRGQRWQSGAACALGACAKLYPAFFLPMLGLAILRRERRLGPDGWRFGLGALGALVAVNGPFLLLNPRLWWMTYQFHLKRTPNFETLWYVLGDYARHWRQPWMTDLLAKNVLDKLVLVALLALLVGLGWMVWTGRVAPIPASFGAMLAFLLTNKIYSVQYTLWVMPFFALLVIPRRKFVALIIADTTVYVGIFTFFAHFSDGRADEYFRYVALGVVLRTLALAWLLVGVFRRAPRTRPMAGTTPTASAA